MIIKSVLKDQITQAILNGYDWLITGAQLGVEQWSVSVADRLKQTYRNRYQIAVMRPFLNFGQRWNSKNQHRMIKTIHRADFSGTVSSTDYQSPRQLFAYQHFMLAHTDGALMIYDPDYPGQSKYDYRAIKRIRRIKTYPITLVTMDDLQEAANEYEINYEEKRRRKFK